MLTTIVISVFGAWAVLSVLGGEMQRQRQNVQLTEMSKRKARENAAKAAAQVPAVAPAPTPVKLPTVAKAAAPAKPETPKGKGKK